MQRVIVIQRVLPHYRVSFFCGLQEDLKSSGIEFFLIYGQEHPNTVPKTVNLVQPWAKRIENTYLNLGRSRMVWQPCLHLLKGADLVIVEQANTLLLNYILLLYRKVEGFKLAFWGHGRNMQARNWPSEKLKRFLINKVDWWFAYTGLTAGIVEASGFPAEKITVVQNAIDTQEFRRELNGISEEEIRSKRAQLGITSYCIGLYCGGMYPDKRLGFLIDACKEVRLKCPEFHLVVIGDGPEQGIVQNAAGTCEWIHYVGPKFGVERALYFKMSKAFLMPGLVGLAILDAFTAGIPIFTTDIPIHSPEISYLQNGKNGFMTSPVVEEYAESVAAYLTSSDLQEIVKSAALEAGLSYTIKDMVSRYRAGIIEWLR